VVLQSKPFVRELEQQRPRLHRLAVRMVGVDAADDDVQQAYLRAWQHRASFERRASFGTWLYRLTVNCCIDFLRRRGREQPFDDIQPVSEDLADAVVDRLHRPVVPKRPCRGSRPSLCAAGPLQVHRRCHPEPARDLSARNADSSLRSE
jgi:RNA polymerase sigma factor (sigma-70 family)